MYAYKNFKKIEKNYIMGDFNIDLSKCSNKNSADFLDILHSSSLLPLIDKSTCISVNSATLIDNIFTNNVFSSITPGIYFNDASEHLPIFQITGKII